MHPLAYQCNLVLGTSLPGTPPATSLKKGLIAGEPTGFVTFLNTLALGVGSLEILRFLVDQPDNVMFSNRRVQGVESAQLVFTLAGSICGLWL